MRRPFINTLIIRPLAALLMWVMLSPGLVAQETAPAAPATLAPAADGDATASSSASSSASSVPAKPPEKPIYASPAERDNALLAKARPDETLWLETPNEKIIALFKAGETRNTKGAVLMLHAPETPQLWPASLENVRRNLPIYGWQTLALALPQKYAIKAPARELARSSAAAASSMAAVTEADAVSSASEVQASSEASSADNASSESANSIQASSASSEITAPVVPREQLIAERVDAAITALNKNGKINVVVMVDNSSANDSLTELYKKVNLNASTQEVIDGPLHAVVIVNLQEQEPLSIEQLGAIFAAEYLPIMDVFFGSDDAAQKSVRRLHRAEAMRKNVRLYQQVVVPPEQYVTIDDKQGFWLEKVRGFMEKHATKKD